MKPLPILVLGKSGSGKSTAIRTLDPEETFIFNCGKKPLPFRGGFDLYREMREGKGNMYSKSAYKQIRLTLDFVNENRPDIKNIVFDDSHYLIISEFMRKHSTDGKGSEIFNLYNQIADHFFFLIDDLEKLREDLFIFFLHHAERHEDGCMYPKTVGKMLNEKVDIPSLFTIVVYAVREGNQNFFITQNDGTTPAKSPDGMFGNTRITNDLQLIKTAAINYYRGVQNAKAE